MSRRKSKRVSNDLTETEEANDPKKPKSSADEPESSTQRPAPQSCSNKKTKKKKVPSAQTPPGIGESWREVPNDEFGKPYFKQLMSFVSEERERGEVYPPAEHVFTWTRMCDVRDVKVVIIGQDPYDDPNQAHGLSFSVKWPEPPPPSLKNIYKELESDIEGFEDPGHGDLTGWAKQGVLLLNTVLTVRARKQHSHKGKGWERFTDAVVQWLNDNMEGLVFMLWGKCAQEKGAAINRERHHVLQAVHPSPIAQTRHPSPLGRGFFGCKHFSEANKLLIESGKPHVDWSAL